VVRLGEVILIRAEALAQLNKLPEAVDEYNKTRVRAGLAPDPRTGRTQADVLNSIYKERRLELAFEGDRWPDLVRRGVAASTLGIPANMTLFPIPQREIDTAPGITQNPGY
jgi:starch-binding outer membrane protein, SusD/RagB family